MTSLCPIDVFISYALTDEPQRRELEKHLATLKQHNLIRLWHVGLVVAGQEHDAETAAHFAKARLILLLVSADYLDAHWMEMESALARHNAGDANVIPIIIKACDWEHAPFSKLRPLPSDGHAVASRPDHSEAWADVARGIRAAVVQLAVPALHTSDNRSHQRPVPTFTQTHYSHATANQNKLRTKASPPATITTHHEAPQKSKRGRTWLVPAISIAATTLVAITQIPSQSTHPTRDATKQAEEELKQLINRLNELENKDASTNDEPIDGYAAEAVDAAEESEDILGPDTPGTISFYDGNRGAGHLLGTISDYPGQRINLVEPHEHIANDKARSCVLHSVRSGAVIVIFDNQNGDPSDDWTTITVKKTHPRYTIPTFEHDIDDDYVQAKHMKKQRLDGRVSRIEID